MDQDDPAVTAVAEALAEYHGESAVFMREPAMRALAAYRRHVLDHRPDAERLAEISDSLQKWEDLVGTVANNVRRHYGRIRLADIADLLAALADATARAEAAEAERDAQRQVAEHWSALESKAERERDAAHAETARLGRDWGHRCEQIVAERDAAEGERDAERAAADYWQARYEELLAERGVER